MKTIKLKSNHTVTLYDSIKSLPQSRRNEIEKAAMMRLHVGSSTKDQSNHLSTLNEMIGGMLRAASQSNRNDEVLNHGEKVLQQLKNMNMNYYLVMDKIDIRSHEFHALIYKIDSHVVDSQDNETVDSNLSFLEKHGLKSGMVEDLIFDIKKNLIPNYGQTLQADTALT